MAVSKPNTQERQEVMKKAATAGATFQATGGGHLNSDDYFKAAELKDRENKIKAMEDIKKERGKYCANQFAAIQMIQKKGELTYATESSFTMPEIKTMLKWKKIKQTGTKRHNIIDAYTTAPKPAKIQTIWSRTEEAALDALKSKDIPLQSTALGVAARKMVRNLKTLIGTLDEDSLKELKAILEARSELDNQNSL